MFVWMIILYILVVVDHLANAMYATCWFIDWIPEMYILMSAKWHRWWIYDKGYWEIKLIKKHGCLSCSLLVVKDWKVVTLNCSEYVFFLNKPAINQLISIKRKI